MDAKTKKILIYGAVALGAYLLSKKYGKKSETNETMSNASGQIPCYCNGKFNGFVDSKKDCGEDCARSARVQKIIDND